ncbi:polyprenol phosphomannose-dependent alpha 1,6 mannosyltransferase MptB [Phytohabitans sp. LJ34]|uniref:polyprenol phosphomannose-dependent alpha 1,6 mannosyltransferase MptB n=1 Tax=Phytohabitans sp. LJ34 TaxID=3452217 RepID=UPI003F8A60C0
MTRWLGLAAAVLVAAGSYAAGALPGGDPGPELRRLGLGATPVPFQIGLAACLVGMVGLVAAWWRLGAMVRAGEVGARGLAVTGALWALPLLVAAPLGSRDVYSYACQGWLYASGADPYTLSPAGGGCPWVAAVAPVWRDETAPYGPVAIALAAGAAWLGGGLLATVGALRLVAAGGMVLAAVALPRLARTCGVEPVRAAWLGVCTPLVAVHAIAGAHYDALLAGLVVAGLAAAATGKPTSAGLALGLAVAVKVTAVVALPFAVLLLARPVRRWLVAGVAAAAFAAASLLGGLGWVGALGGATDQTQWTSVPTGVGMSVGYLLRGFGAGEGADDAVLAARLAGLGLLALALAALVVGAWRRRTDTRAVVLHCGAALAALALLSPIFYPWYALTALAVLAAAARAPVRRWLAVATGALTFLTLPNGLGVAALTKLPGAFLVLALVIAVAWAWLRPQVARAALKATSS